MGDIPDYTVTSREVESQEIQPIYSRPVALVFGRRLWTTDASTWRATQCKEQEGERG